jgi:hypothetical protein
MNKKVSTNKIKADQILKLLQLAPEKAYKKLISSIHHYFNSALANDFWDAFQKLDIEKLANQFPESSEIFYRFNTLKMFNDMNNFYEEERDLKVKFLVSLKVDRKLLVKSFFLCLELGETRIHQTNFYGYSEESLEAIKSSLAQIVPLLSGEGTEPYSVELLQYSNDLIRIQVDIALLAQYVDAFVWAGFELSINEEENGGYILSLPTENVRRKNPFILNQLKTFVKRNFKIIEAHPEISLEEHFKKIDQIWKTHEGYLSALYSSGCTITSNTPGTTALQVDNDSFLTDLTSDDATKRTVATTELELMKIEQNFHVNYRHALSQIYQPNDEIDIHALHLELEPDIFVTFYELICAMSCVIAKAHTFKHISQYPNSGSIAKVKTAIINIVAKENPGLCAMEIENFVNDEIVHNFRTLDQRYEQKAFFFFERSTIVGWFRKIEELKSKSVAELEAIVNLLSNFDSPLPFNPFYNTDGKYYFSYLTCCNFNLNQYLFDYYISDKLFKSVPDVQSHAERKFIGENHKGREVRFTYSLKSLFKTITPYVEAAVDYGNSNINFDFGDLRGEIDLVAYFENENIIMPIQVKLSNTSPKSEKRKQGWVNTQIIEKCLPQVNKDVKLLEFKQGLQFISKQLKTKIEITNPCIYPLIVTDNFFADHQLFPYGEKGHKVSCVSYFEILHLIRGRQVHSSQNYWPPFVEGNAAARLIEAIESNAFWKFLDEAANIFTFSKSLMAITKEYRIEMKV